MKPWFLPSGPSTGQLCWVSALSLGILLFASARPVCARFQEPLERSAQSIAEAARNAREQKSNVTKHPKVITNDDIVSQSLSTEVSRTPAANETEAAAPQTPVCSNPAEAERLKLELQSAQDERARIGSELSYEPTVISGGNLDMRNFMPGSSGVNVGSAPLIQTQPQAPARVQAVAVSDNIESLAQALQIACAPPEEAAILTKLTLLERQLSWLQREFALNQDSYYTQTNFARDTSGQFKLDGYQQQIESLQSEIRRLKDALAALKAD